MPPKSPIDIKRDAAGMIDVGGDDKSPIKDTLSTGKNLYLIKVNGVYKIQLADQIDPKRTNPDIPNLNQQVLTAGYDNQIIAKVLLTAKYLFDERNADVKPFLTELFENCIVLTRQILELDATAQELTNEISQKKEEFDGKPFKPNAVILPSIPELETKVHSILSKADKIKDTLLTICRLQFMPNTQGKVKIADLEKTIEQSLSSEPQLIEGWKGISKYFALLRNARNASEHPKDNYQVILNDFAMWPDGKVYPPLIEIQHPETAIRSLPLVEFLDFIRATTLEHAETILVFIRLASLIQNNPFQEWVVEFPEEKRRHKLVRFYRALNLGDNWQILG